MADLDRGGTVQQWQRSYLGPSLGWVNRPVRNELSITAAGTYIVDLATNYVKVNFNGPGVIIQLPSVKNSAGGAQAQPGLYTKAQIVIEDIGGFAGTNNITIQPTPGETIMGLASIPIATNFGAFTLAPDADTLQWISVSP